MSTHTQGNTVNMTGIEAIEFADNHDMTLRKHEDPIEDAGEGLTPDEARKVAQEDQSLIYLTLRCIGWTDGDGTGHEGYSVADYFSDGYLGPDTHGIEPIMESV
jgi:hypothetical protein